MALNIQYFDSLDSSNKEVMRQAMAGAEAGLVVVAKAQTAGKGRLGRAWQTLDHALAMTVLLRPDMLAVDVPKLSLVAAVALHEALATFVSDGEIGIKWPNDILIDGKKVSGILTEMRCQGATVQAVALGMGINIVAPSSWDKTMRTPPTSIQQHSQRQVDKDEVLQAVLAAWEKWYACFMQQGFFPIRQAWWKAHLASDKLVSVHDGERYIAGKATGLAADGGLMLLVNGVEQRIIVGDVTILGET